METKNLVRRGGVSGDARLKKITITEKGEEMRQTLIESRRHMEEKLTANFTEGELEQLYAYMQRMKENMKK